MSDKAIETEAEVIGEIRPLSKADEWLAAAREKVGATVAEYHEWQIQSNDDYRQMKRDRTEVRRRAQEIDSERKAMLSDMEKALRDFKAGVKDVLSPLTALDAAYKAELDAWDERVVEQRRLAMSQEYAEGAPDLVPLVPFDALCRRYATEGKWFLKSTGDARAIEDMWQRVQGIAECEKALDATGLPADILADAKARFFSTLDLADAMTWARGQQEQRERVAELERQREQRRREHEEAERAAREAAATLVGDFAEKVSQIAGAAEGEQSPQTPAGTPDAPQEPPQAPAGCFYVFGVELSDPSQMWEIRKWLVGHGMHGSGIRATSGQFEDFKRSVKEGR